MVRMLLGPGGGLSREVKMMLLVVSLGRSK